MLKFYVVSMFMLLWLLGCGSNKGLISDEAASKIKPLKSVELPQSVMPDNLVLKIRNIADFASSYKNRFELYINGELVRPDNKVDNATSNYTYEMKLQPGYYEVKGFYYWYGGWKEERTTIRTQDLVSVYPDRRTLLDIEIPKDWRGVVTDRDLFFTVSHEPFVREESPVADASVTREAVPVKNGKKIELQINTDPNSCDVIVDDKLLGQTPLRIWIDRESSHVLQIKRENYRSILRLLDYEELIRSEKLFILERLEPLPGFAPMNIAKPATADSAAASPDSAAAQILENAAPDSLSASGQ